MNLRILLPAPPWSSDCSPFHFPMFGSALFPEPEEQKAAWYPSYNRKEMRRAVWEEPLDSSM